MNNTGEITAKRPDGRFVRVPAHLEGTHAWRVQKLVKVRDQLEPVMVAPIQVKDPQAFTATTSTSEALPEITAEELATATTTATETKRGPGRPRKNQS